MTGASISGRLHRGPDGLLRFEVGRDLAAVVELLELGFQEDLDDRDRRWLRDLSTLSGAGPLLNLLVHTLPRARTAFTGFVWYVEGRLLGNVSLIRRPDGAWTIANVVTHPAARRRGIARRLMEAALGAAIEREATRVQLSVRQDNGPALELYDQLGFERSGLLTSLRRAAGAAPPTQAVATSGFAIVPWPRPDDARVRRLLSRIEEPTASGMGAALLGATRRGAMRTRIDDWMHVRRRVALAASTGSAYRAVVLALCESQPVAVQHLAFAIDPAWRGQVERPLVTQLLDRLAEMPPAPAEIEVSSNEPALEDALRSRGFRERRVLAQLTIDLD